MCKSRFRLSTDLRILASGAFNHLQPHIVIAMRDVYRNASFLGHLPDGCFLRHRPLQSASAVHLLALKNKCGEQSIK